MKMEWRLKGGHAQKTREGYQLLNLQSGTQNGITYYIDNKGYFCMSGTCTSDRITLNLNEIALNGTYTFTNKSISGGGINCALKDNTSEYKNIFFTNNNNETKEVHTILKDLVCYLTNGVTYNLKIKLMLVSGSQEKDIEQYGMMPSTDYPSEVKTVGDNINLFCIDCDEEKNGIKFTKNVDGSYNVFGTATADAYFGTIFSIQDSKLINGETYNIHSNIAVSVSEVEILVEGYKNNTWKGHLLKGASCPAVKAVNLTDLTHVRFGIRVKQGVSIDISSFKIKLEKGSTATPWSPYRNG